MKRTLYRLAIAATMLTIAMPSVADGEKITVYKSPTCTCCERWISHLRTSGFDVDAIDTNDLMSIKSLAGIGLEDASCHTARVEGYVIEGHVPAQDIRRLLAERPEIRGLTVPGMPMGSPGMEGPRRDPYNVMTLEEGDSHVYASH